jgi:hypothetical protein
MAIRTFNSVGGFSYGENATIVISTDGNISNVANAVIGNVTASTQITAGNVTSNNLANTRVTFTKDSVLSDSANFTFTGGNVLTVKDAANIVSSDGANYVSITGSNGGITSTGNANLAGGALTIDTNGDVAVSNSFIVGSSGANGDSAFYVDATGNFSIKIANTADTANGGFTTVFQVDSTSGNITTAGSVVSPGGGAATISAPGLNTQILFNDDGNVGAVPEFTFDKTSNTLTVTGSANISGSLDVNGVLNLWDDLFIDGGNISSPSYVVLPQGGYLYDRTDTGAAVLHAETGGYAQLEYLNDTWVWVDENGAYMGTGDNQITANQGDNIEITVTGSTWSFGTDGNLSVPGTIYANAGNITTTSSVNTGTLEVTDTANIGSDAIIQGSLTVNGGAESYLTGNVVVGTIGDNDANVDISNNLHVYNDANIDGVLTIGNLKVTHWVKSDLLPDQDVTYDLGSDGHRWRDLWLSGFTINLGNTTISSGGSNVMIVNNAIVGYGATVAGATYTPAVGNLYAGYLTTSNNVVLGNSTAKANILVTGSANIAGGDAASSTTTGALTVTGGVGITGNIYVGSAANITGNVLIDGAEANISTGNLRIGGNANVINDMVIGGNLTVSGTTTYVNTTNSSIKDALIDIAGGDNGADLAGSDAYDRGLYIHNYDSGVNNQFMGWKQGSNEFQLLTNATASDNQVTGDYADLRLATLYTDHLYGTVETADQPNIANLAGVYDIAVSNLADINLAQVTTLVASGLNYPTADGAAPGDNEVVVLRTDGSENLTFEVIHTDRIGNALSGSEIYVDGGDDNGNITFTVNGNATPTLVVSETGANVTGDFDVTGELSAGTLTVGELTPDSITLGDTTIQDVTFTTPDDTVNQVIAEVTASEGNAAEFFVKGIATVAGVKKVTVATITAMYDGSGVDFAVYGKLNMGGGAGTFNVNYGGGKLQLQVTPTAVGTVDTVWTAQIRTI